MAMSRTESPEPATTSFLRKALIPLAIAAGITAALLITDSSDADPRDFF